MRSFPFLLILITIILFNKQSTCVANDNAVNEPTTKVEETHPTRNFQKDLEELDLSGYEEDIKDVEELSKEKSYSYVTQIYVYIRIDGEYEIYKTTKNLIDLGSRYMTLLEAAMLPVQLKRTSLGVFTCYFTKKDMIPDLVTFFLIQKEVDFIDANKKEIFPEGRKAPIIGRKKRQELDEIAVPDDNL